MWRLPVRTDRCLNNSEFSATFRQKRGHYVRAFCFLKTRKVFKTFLVYKLMTILLLNASYEPLTVIPQRRAISLMLRGRVDAATDEAVALRSTHSVFEIPHVLRLRKYVNVPRRGARWTRRGVLQRDGYRCAYCGIGLGRRQRGQVIRRDDFTIDHVVPRSKGGRNTWGNTVCACTTCNNRKADKLPNEAGMKLLWEPKIPRVDYLVASGDVPEAWKIYLPMKG